MPGEGRQRQKIKQFWKFIYCNFPSNQLRTLFRSKRKPIFGKIMETPGLVIPMHKRKIDNAFVESSYVSATGFLCENYSYMFGGPGKAPRA